MKKKDIYNKAKHVYGIDAQVTKAVEELAELQKELCKFILDDGNMKNIAEETADVKIMIDQIELMLEIKEEVKAFKKVKINRLSDRLEIENPSYLKNDCNWKLQDDLDVSSMYNEQDGTCQYKLMAEMEKAKNPTYGEVLKTVI